LVPALAAASSSSDASSSVTTSNATDTNNNPFDMDRKKAKEGIELLARHLPKAMTQSVTRIVARA
jgi:hypothetical protein